MGNSAQKQASHGDVDHGVGHVEAGFVVAHEPAPAHHPAESALDPYADLPLGYAKRNLWSAPPSVAAAP